MSLDSFLDGMLAFGTDGNRLALVPAGELVPGARVDIRLPAGWAASEGRWQRDSGAGFADIDGQTGLSYVLRDEDFAPVGSAAGHQLQFALSSGFMTFYSAPLALPVSTGRSRYMIAANRFGLATDWGMTDARWAAGDGTGRSGGDGSLLANSFSRRYKFTTTWAARAGRFLWANAANSINAMLDGRFAIVLSRVEVRDSTNQLVDTVKWAGVAAKTLAPGEKTWNDPIADLAADTTYYLDVFFQMPTASGAWPADQGFFLSGESSRDSKTVDLSQSPIATDGVGSAIGGYFAPSMFAARGWDGEAPVWCIFGDSIEDGTNVSAQLAPARGDIGAFREALGDPTGAGAWNYMHTSRWASSPATLYQDDLNRQGGRNLVDWLSEAMALVQPEPMFNAVLMQHGRNALGGANGFAAASRIMGQALDKLQAKFPGVSIVGTSVTPMGINNANKGTSIAGQVPYDRANTDSGGDFRTFHDWIMGGAGGRLAMAIDTAQACRDETHFDRWRPGGFAATLVAPVAAASTNVCRLSAPPQQGDTLVFAPDSDNVDVTSRVGIVTEVTRLADNDYQVTMNGGRRSQYAPRMPALASCIVRAHAAGTLVKSTLSHDLTHPSQRAQWGMRDILVAHKPAMKALIKRNAGKPAHHVVERDTAQADNRSA